MEIRIIIADDHPVVIQGIQDVLRAHQKFNVIETFSDGKLLLQSPALATADVLLLDLNMPGIDGLQVLDELNKMQLPLTIIVVTTYVSSLLAQTCMEDGVHVYLVK